MAVLEPDEEAGDKSCLKLIGALHSVGVRVAYTRSQNETAFMLCPRRCERNVHKSSMLFYASSVSHVA